MLLMLSFVHNMALSIPEAQYIQRILGKGVNSLAEDFGEAYYSPSDVWSQKEVTIMIRNILIFIKIIQ